MDNLAGPVQDNPQLSGFEAPEWRPHKYQVRGVGHLLNTEAALFFPPGLGKTSTSLAAFLELRKLGFACRMLILAPLKVCESTWLTEPKRWAQFQSLRVGFAHGPDKISVLNDLKYDIVLLNYDGIAWAAPQLQAGHKFDILLCDEITRLKNTSSKRFKALKPCLPSFKFRWGLTGTPAANGLMDLFGQVYVLDMGKRLGRFITHFRLKYFYQKPWDQYRYYIDEVHAEMLTKQLSDLALYVSPEEWLELPEFLPIVRPVGMPAKLRKDYDFLLNEFLLKLDDAVLTAANAGVLTSKLRQFTGGAVYSSEGVWSHLHDEKLDVLEDLVEEMAGEPLMIAYQFDHERERLVKRFPNALVLKGGMSSKQTQDVIEQWNAGAAEILLVQPASAAMGLNLQFGGSAICWFTLTYNFEEYTQLNKRLHRQGQTKTVRCYLLSMADTIDEQVAKTLARKDSTQEDLFNLLK